jgi:hypothetical protein
MYEIVCGHVVGPQNSPIMIAIYPVPILYVLLHPQLHTVREARVEGALEVVYIYVDNTNTYERSFESHLLSSVDAGRDEAHTTSHQRCVRNSHATH